LKLQAHTQTVCMAVSLPLAIGLAMLLVWNAYLVYTNKTTVEHYEGVTARILASRCALLRHKVSFGNRR